MVGNLYLALAALVFVIFWLLERYVAAGLPDGMGRNTPW